MKSITGSQILPTLQMIVVFELKLFFYFECFIPAFLRKTFEDNSLSFGDLYG